MLKRLLGHCRISDARNLLARTTTLVASLDSDLERAGDDDDQVSTQHQITEFERHYDCDMGYARRMLRASFGVFVRFALLRAKIASDWRKPDGLFVIQPHQIADFLAPLAVRTLPGEGGATERALAELGITTVLF